MRDSELIEGFVADSTDMLDEAEPNLIELQKAFEAGQRVDKERLDAIFRLFHSLKGAAAFLNFDNIAKITHEAETLLNSLREGKGTLTDSQMDAIFESCDFIRRLLSVVNESGSDEGFESDASQIMARLKGTEPPTDICTKDDTEPPLERSPEASDHEANNPDQPLEDSNQADAQQAFITPEMREQFIQESDELLEEIEKGLINLEKSKDNEDILAEAFRNIHSFKGNSGFMGYSDLERLSHKAETVLDHMKEGRVEAEGENITILLKIVDVLRSAVAEISTGGDGSIQGVDLYMELMDDMMPVMPETEAGHAKPVGEILIERGDATPDAVQEALELQSKPVGEILVDMGKTSPKAVEAALAVQQGKQKTKKLIRRDIRVDLDKLNELNDLVGELVTAQMMVIRNPDLRGYEFENFEKAAHHLEQISASLQDVAMSLRMIPVSGLFTKMMRLVRDLCRKCGKKVDLTMKGEDTEVDKTVIELISDPLVHIIRNSVDHGIESPKEREQAGKSPIGTVELEAKHEGGEVWIVVRDDGRGLDRDKILQKALEKGLVEGDGANLQDDEVYRLIFEPGFSTAEQVSDISGRGVGMDVVRKNIEQLKGRVDIQSKPGEGTAISIRIPLTLAIIQGMLVRAGEWRYLIPLLAIRESFRPRRQDITVMPGGQEMVKVREELMPVVRLNEVYNLGNGKRKLQDGILVTLENQNNYVCLFVDEILGQMETVIKGLPRFMGAIQGIAGCTILGDGQVSLILDVGGLMERIAL